MYTEFWAQVKQIKDIAKDTLQVTFKYDEGSFKFMPGQYVWVVLQQLNFPDEKGERRAFSVTSSVNSKNELTIQFRNSTSGYKKTLLSLPIGGRVKIVGPFGSSYVPNSDQKRIVMIAGGVGVAPFLSILRSLDILNNDKEYVLLYLNSSPEKGVYYDELNAVTSSFKIPFLNHVGDFKDNLLPNSVNFSEDNFFACGPPGMIDEVYKILVAKGVPFDRMHFEQHYPTPNENLTENDFVQKPGERNIMHQAIRDSKNHVIITDVNGQIIFANETAEKNTGYSFSEMRGNTPRLWGGMMPIEFYHSFWHKKHESGGFDGEITNRKKDGSIYYVITHISPIKNDKGIVIGYIGTEEDITKEKQIDRAKTEFISLASHQLRTPLSTINWYCEMLLAGDAGVISDKQKQFIQEAYDGSRRMTKLVNSLLNVSRIETGTYMVQPEMTDVVKLARSILDESKPMIDEKKLTVKLEKEEIPQIMLDPNLTIMIFQNLLTNSVKYTPEGGVVTITLKVVNKNDIVPNEVVDTDSLLIQVSDTGMGIPNNQKNEVFTKLFRADNARKSDAQGSGLGLYLIKSLIEHSKGKIWFTSEENKGTTFFVLLPLSGMVKVEGEKKLNL